MKIIVESIFSKLVLFLTKNNNIVYQNGMIKCSLPVKHVIKKYTLLMLSSNKKIILFITLLWIGNWNHVDDVVYWLLGVWWWCGDDHRVVDTRHYRHCQTCIIIVIIILFNRILGFIAEKKCLVGLLNGIVSHHFTFKIPLFLHVYIKIHA